MNVTNDEKIVVQIKTGDSESFGALYDQYIKKIYSFIYYRTNHKETAEDLTSIVFTKAYESIRRYDESKGKFSSWVYRIARNTVIDHYRTEKKESALGDIAELVGNDDRIDEKTDANITLQKVIVSLDQLSNEQKDILIMRLWDGLSHKEIGEILDKNENSIKMTFSRALKKLREINPGISMLLIYLAIVVVSRRA